MTTVNRNRERASRPPADVESAVHALGLEIRKADEYEIHSYCPMHAQRMGKEDRNPSFSVNRNTGLAGCWSCGYGGTFHKLVMDLKFPNDAFRAARWIRQFGIDLSTKVESLKLWDDRHVLAAEEDDKDDLPGLFAMYTDPPTAALDRRGISRDAARFYGLRWDGRKHHWIIPIRDAESALMGWQIKGDKDRLFLNYPRGVKKGRTLFGLSQFPAGELAIVMESPLDVVRLYSAGFEGGLATFGSKYTEQQMRLVSDVTDKMIAAFDNDESGDKALEMLLRGNKKEGRQSWLRRINIWVANYEDIEAKDIGDMDNEEIEWTITAAVHSTKFLTAHLQ